MDKGLRLNGVGIAGICLIRLEQIKPQFMGGTIGIASENAAHRIAVEWEEGGQRREGVFIPRRDTSSRFNYWVGGRLFPGMHNHAHFDTSDSADHYRVALKSDDGLVSVLVEGHIDQTLPATSIFGSVENASQFFEGGSLGYSVTHKSGEYDGLELRSFGWKVEPFSVERIQSSFFEDERTFPKGSLQFDCALIMRNIQHEWLSQPSLCCAVAAEESLPA